MWQVGHKMLGGLKLRTSKGCIMGESPPQAPDRCPASWKQRLCIKHSLAAGRMESGIRPVTEECNQSAFYYVLQQGHGTLRPLLHMSFFPSHCMCDACLALIFGSVCMCLDECVRILLIRYVSVLHAWVLLSVFQWENVWTVVRGVCHT